MLVLVVYAFSISVYTVATGAVTEATNLSVGIVDEDRSDLSREIAEALVPPTFQKPVQIAAAEIDPKWTRAICSSSSRFRPISRPTFSAQRKTSNPNQRRRDRGGPGRQRRQLSPDRHIQ